MDKVDDDNDRNYIKQLERGLDDAIKKAKDENDNENVEEPGVKDSDDTSPTGGNKSDDAISDSKESSGADAEDLDKRLESMSDEDKLNLLKDQNTSESDRIKIKASFYLAGYGNYDGKTAVTKNNFKVVHDTGLGNKADIKEVIEVDTGTPPKTIKMKTTNKPQKVTYTYQETKDGEYLYVSNVGGQTYVLQQHGNEFSLVQYQYHDGWNKVDINQK